MEVKFRVVDINDVRVLQELNQEVFIDNYQYDQDLIMDWALSEKGEQYFSNLVKDKQAYCYLAGREKKFSYRKNRYFEIENMGVIPKYRSQGIDKMLINQAKQWAREQGYQTIFVNSYFHNLKAIAFYKRNNMAEIDLSLEGNL